MKLRNGKIYKFEEENKISVLIENLNLNQIKKISVENRWCPPFRPVYDTLVEKKCISCNNKCYLWDEKCCKCLFVIEKCYPHSGYRPCTLCKKHASYTQINKKLKERDSM